MQSLLCALFQKSSWDREPILPAGGQRPLRLAIPPLMKTEQASGRGQFIVVTGVNSYGHNTGVYDLGSLGSTHCPGPQCQAISFVLRTGVFSSFEDPVAAPQTTFAFSINDLDQTCGSFTDLVGHTHVFVRNRNGFGTMGSRKIVTPEVNS